MARKATKTKTGGARTKILDGALKLIRTNGFAATSVDALCESAGVSKGSFFHHFESKEDLAVQAAKHWSEITSTFFATASYQLVDDPFERLIAYVQLRKNLLRGEIPDFTCLVGTMVQEAYSLHPTIQKACRDSIFGHAETLLDTVVAAQKMYAAEANWDPLSLALYIQASIQGAFILAKAGNSVQPAISCLEHLERYIHLLFQKSVTHS